MSQRTISGGMPPLCAAPRVPVNAPAFKLPVGACDTHAHVISADRQRYPLVENRSYTPQPAPEETYLQVLHNLGIERGVLVQPSIYGTDNSYMLDVLERHPTRLRGVAVIDDQTSDQELERMQAAGVRGIRFNVLFRGGTDLEQMERLAARVAPLGWHVQFLIDVRNLPQLQSRMLKLTCPIVVDHMGHLPAASALQEPGFQLLLNNVAEHGWWVKLSGVYRLSDAAPNYPDTDGLARRLIDAAPERMLWGSDWPHVAMDSPPATELLLNRLPVWLPDERQRQQVLTDNPARLYAFQ